MQTGRSSGSIPPRVWAFVTTAMACPCLSSGRRRRVNPHKRRASPRRSDRTRTDDLHITSPLSDSLPDLLSLMSFRIRRKLRFLHKKIAQTCRCESERHSHQRLSESAESGTIGDKLVSGMHHAIAALARAGNNILAEHVLVEPKWALECVIVFAELPAYLVGVHCSLETLELRERGRGDRTLGQARAQFPIIHKYVDYDFEVDASHTSAKTCALEIQKRLQSTVQPMAFQRIRGRSCS